MSNNLRNPLTRFLGLRMLSVLSLLSVVLLGGCGGIDTIAEPTETFAANNYRLYAWRSEPPSREISSKDKLQQKSPSIRAGVEEKMSQLGYRRVEKSEAEFLIEYLADVGYNDGQVSHTGSNEVLYPSSVNRHIDGASVDNAYALGGMVETGNVMLVFVDAASTESLWQVRISMVVKDTNRIDEAQVRRAVRKGLATLPPAS